MRRRKLIAIAAALSILCTMPAAYGATEQVGNGTEVRVYGNAGESNTPIAIEVYQGALEDEINGEDLLGMDKEDYLSILVCHDQGMTDENGEYSFSFNISLSSGRYTVYTATPSTVLPAEEFMYISNEDFKKAVQLLNEAPDSSTVAGYIRQYPYEIGLTPEDVENLQIDGLANVLFETIKEIPLDPENRESTRQTVQKAVFVQKLNEGKITDIYAADAAVNGLQDSAVSEWYEKSYVTDTLKKDLTGRVTRKGFSGYGAYTEALTDAFILATVKTPNGNGNVKNIMTEFEERIGIEASDADSNVWSDLAGEDFESLSALASEFRRLCQDGGSGSGGGSSSGGGGSSSGGRGGSVNSGNPVEIGGAVQEDVTDQKLPEDIFTDLDTVEWAKPSIIALAQMGILSGEGDGTFRPNDSITREEFCKLAVEAFVPDAEAAAVSFTDVPAGAWYCSYVQKAYGAGIAQGMGDGTFGTGQPITRQDMSVMIYLAARASGMQFEEETDQSFADDAQIADYAKSAVYALRNAGAVNGVTETQFAPEETATRAQAAKMIYALLAD